MYLTKGYEISVQSFWTFEWFLQHHVHGRLISDGFCLHSLAAWSAVKFKCFFWLKCFNGAACFANAVSENEARRAELHRLWAALYLRFSTGIWKFELRINSVQLKLLFNSCILVVQSLVWRDSGAADGIPGRVSVGFQWSLLDAAQHCTLALTRPRAFSVASKRGFLRLLRFTAVFAAQMLCFWDYSVCFQARVTEFADLLFISLMRCVFEIVIREKIDKLKSARPFLYFLCW